MNRRILMIIIITLGIFALGLIGGVAVSRMGAGNDNATTSPTLPSTSIQTPASALPTEVAISPDQASQIALETIRGATLTQEPILVRFQGNLAYEVRLDLGSIWIDAQNGQILYNGTNPNATPVEALQITPEQAITIARDYVGGGTVAEVDLEHEDDPRGAAYEVVFSDESKVFVDATTGEVVYARLRSHDAPPRPEERDRHRPGEADEDD